MPKVKLVLNSRSPAQVPVVGSNGTDMDTDSEDSVCVVTTPDDSGAPAMRMSPKRESPCSAPGVPSGEPSSATTLKLMLALAAQVCNARSTSPCQTLGWIPCARSVEPS